MPNTKIRLLFISQNEKFNDIMPDWFNYANFHLSFAELQIKKIYIECKMIVSILFHKKAF